MLVVIVVLGVVAVTITKTAGNLAEESARNLKTRQMMVFAQGLLEEVRYMPFTTFDPAAGGASFSATVDALGFEAGETRYNAANRFDGVSDYQNFTMPVAGACTGLCDIYGTVLNGSGALSGCNARVVLAAVAVNGVPATDAWRILVTLRCPGVDNVTAEGIRIRHAPNAL